MELSQYIEWRNRPIVQFGRGAMQGVTSFFFLGLAPPEKIYEVMGVGCGLAAVLNIGAAVLGKFFPENEPPASPSNT